MNGSKQENSNVEHPEEGELLIFKIFVKWVTPLVKLATKRPLKENDVWNCPQKHNVSTDSSKFVDAWEAEKSKSASPNLVHALFRAYGKDFVSAGWFQLVFLACQIAQPFLVGELVGFVATGAGGLRHGLGLAFGLAAISLVSSISLSYALYLLRNLGVSVRSGMMMAVYEHALKLTTASRLKNTVGQTTNLMAIDAEKLFVASLFIHFMWHGPLTCFIVMIILITQIGYAPALAGMACMMLFIPMQNYLANQVGIIRRKMVQFTDERVKLTNEFLQAIRIIKFYAWEVPMEQRVQSVRNKELSTLVQYLAASSRLREVSFSIQPVAALIMFTTSVYGMNKPLTVVQIFRVLAFLNITRYPLNLLAQALKNYSDGSVSVSRLNKFLLLPTLSIRSRKEDIVTNPSIAVSNATFSWIDDDYDEEDNSNDKSQQHSSKKDKNIVINDKKYDTITNNTQDIETGLDDDNNQNNDKQQQRFALRNIQFTTTKPNELIAIIGQVGSGKSSLISALLNEIPIQQGSCHVDGNISYCAQTPWIQNLSLKENILFGSTLQQSSQQQQYSSSTDSGIKESEDHYQKTLKSAALMPDLAILPHGDETEIGDRGINLSGGQKARVSIARALYSSYRSQIFLFDDPFSAVDGNTGNWIFHHGILHLLHDKIRIIALNSHLHLLRYVHRIVIMDNGYIIHDGTLQEIMERDNELTRITGIDFRETQLNNTGSSPLPYFTDDNNNERNNNDNGDVNDEHRKEEAVGSANNTKNDAKSTPSKKLIEVEKVKTGSVSMSTYIKYFGASLLPTNYFQSRPFFDTSSHINLNSPYYIISGSLVMIGLILVFSLAQLSRLSVDYYLAKWASSGGDKHSYWSTVYYSSFGCLIGFLCVRAFYLNHFAVLSTKNVHAAMLRSILSAPIPTFFDTHTVGEILNRFAKDTETVDSSVPEFLSQVIVNWAQVLSVFALCIWTSYWFVLILGPLFLGFYIMYRRFSCVSRDLKRFESMTRSPIYASLSETLLGLETIRAYADSNRFISMHLKRMERNQKFFYHLWMCMSWVTIRLELATSFILLAISLLAVSLRTTISPISLGLALSFGLQLTALFQRCVQVSIDVATYMTSTERIMEYLEIPQETSVVVNNTHNSNSSNSASHSNSINNSNDIEMAVTNNTTSTHHNSNNNNSNSSISTWPTTGNIEFDQVWMQYRDNPPILKGISFHINKGERIGVCGRTGAGKSSLMIALFRVVELMEGKIYIDNHEISQIPLQILRSKLAIIPQDPVLLTGTIRYQLDPFDQYNDEEIWNVLEAVNMKETIKSMPNTIQELVKENGENLSQGQKQLLCIARALLKQTHILVVDEGTSAVDPQTDELIQTVLRNAAETRSTTIIAIAHRLQTIIDFDKILVLGNGHIIEYDTPEILLSNEQSVFRSMINAAAH